MKKNKLALTVLAALALTLTLSLAPVRTQAATKFEKKIVKEVKKAGLEADDTNDEVLKKIFEYMTFAERDTKGVITKQNYKYARATTFAKDVKKKTWTQTYAQKMISTKAGSCYQYASLFGYMALKGTGLPVRVAVGTTKGYGKPNQAHAWTEVKIGKKWYIYDTIMDKFSPKVKKPLTYYKKLKTSKVKKQYYNYKGAKYFNLSF